MGMGAGDNVATLPARLLEMPMVELGEKANGTGIQEKIKRVKGTKKKSREGGVRRS